MGARSVADRAAHATVAEPWQKKSVRLATFNLAVPELLRGEPLQAQVVPLPRARSARALSSDASDHALVLVEL